MKIFFNKYNNGKFKRSWSKQNETLLTIPKSGFHWKNDPVRLEESSTGWNDKNVVLKKTTLQLYFKTFIEKINSGNLIM